MNGIIREMWNYLLNYMGNGMMMILFVLSMVYIILTDKERRKYFVYPAIIIIIVIYNPICYKFIWKHIVSEEMVFWRMFWLFPVVPVISYAIVRLINTFSKTIVKIAAIVLLAVVVMISGTSAYTSATFEKSTNYYKLDEKTINIAEDLLQYSEEPEVLAPTSLSWQLRQYSAKIKLKIDAYLDTARASKSDILHICSLALRDNIQLIVINKSQQFDISYYNMLGYQLYAEGQDYVILSSSYTKKASEWMVSGYYNNETEEAFLTVKDNYGRLLAIDGGSNKNNGFVRSIIEENGSVVNTWLLSNISADTCGACMDVMVNMDKVSVMNLMQARYGTEMRSFVDDANDSYESIEELDYRLYTTFQDWWYVKEIEANKELELLDAKVTVYNYYDESNIKDIKELEDGTVVFKLQGNEKSILYIGDCSEDSLENIINKYKSELTSDYVIINGKPDNMDALLKVVNPIQVFDMSDGNDFNIELY